jgi:hypothetical protein
MEKNRFNASTLRSLLLVSAVIITAAIVLGFYYAQVWLSNNANTIKTNSYQSISSNLNANEMAQLQSDVYNHKAVSIKATELFYSKLSYEAKVRQDLNNYASKIGISITDFMPAQAPTVDSNSMPINGVMSEYFSVTIANPVQFTNLFEFIQAIETNIPKMKLTGVSISAENGQNVTVKPMIIEIYTR